MEINHEDRGLMIASVARKAILDPRS